MFILVAASNIENKRQVAIVLYHDSPDQSESNLKIFRLIGEFARNQGVDFYPEGRGIGHQIMVEAGYAFSGTLAMASNLHATSYGGLGSLGIDIFRINAASI